MYYKYIVIYVLKFSNALLFYLAVAITNKFSGNTLGNHDETLTSPLLSLNLSIPLNNIITYINLYYYILFCMLLYNHYIINFLVLYYINLTNIQNIILIFLLLIQPFM